MVYSVQKNKFKSKMLEPNTIQEKLWRFLFEKYEYSLNGRKALPWKNDRRRQYLNLLWEIQILRLARDKL